MSKIFRIFTVYVEPLANLRIITAVVSGVHFFLDFYGWKFSMNKFIPLLIYILSSGSFTCNLSCLDMVCVFEPDSFT